MLVYLVTNVLMPKNGEKSDEVPIRDKHGRLIESAVDLFSSAGKSIEDCFSLLHLVRAS